MRIALLVTVLAVSACDTTADQTRLDVSTLSHDRAKVVGTWDLISGTSSGQSGPPTTSPASGLSYTFSDDGTAEVRRAGQPSVATTWTVSGRYDLTIGTSREYFGVDGDRLYFDSRPVDGSLLEFARR